MNPDLSKLPLCDQDWNAMEPLGDGRRFCARCRHPVTDFRGMSKDEITLVHVMSDERVCGVYSPQQLAPAAAEPRRCRGGLVTLALGASLLAARADAQSAPSPAAEQAQLPRDASPAKAAVEAAATAPAAQNDTLVIRGTVRDAGTRAPLAQVVVYFERDGVRRTALTDAAGGYTLRIPDPGSQEVRLRFGRIGYATAIATVREKRGEATADVTLTTAAVGLMGIVVTPAPRDERAAELRKVGYSVSRILGSR